MQKITFSFNRVTHVGLMLLSPQMFFSYTDYAQTFARFTSSPYLNVAGNVFLELALQ